jgi:hypothetical protein
LPKQGKKIRRFLNLFVGERAERIEKDSRGSFVGLGGYGKRASSRRNLAILNNGGSPN